MDKCAAAADGEHATVRALRVPQRSASRRRRSSKTSAHAVRTCRQTGTALLAVVSNTLTGHADSRLWAGLAAASAKASARHFAHGQGCQTSLHRGRPRTRQQHGERALLCERAQGTLGPKSAKTADLVVLSVQTVRSALLTCRGTARDTRAPCTALTKNSDRLEACVRRESCCVGDRWSRPEGRRAERLHLAVTRCGAGGLPLLREL